MPEWTNDDTDAPDANDTDDPGTNDADPEDTLGAYDADEPRSRLGESRRAILVGLVGLVLLVVPVFVANAMIGDESPSAATTDAAAVSNEQRRLRDQTTTSTTAAPTTTAAPAPTTTAPPPPPPPPTTAPPPPPAPPPTTTAPAPAAAADSGGAVPDPYSYATWDTLSQCESGGDWSINTGNGYYGGVQFSLSSWQAVGGTGYPHEASRETQITMAIRLWERQGWGAWPACTAELGWR
jgi:Transglycosylase-like domain